MVSDIEALAHVISQCTTTLCRTIIGISTINKVPEMEEKLRQKRVFLKLVHDDLSPEFVANCFNKVTHNL